MATGNVLLKITQTGAGEAMRIFEAMDMAAYAAWIDPDSPPGILEA